MEGMDSDRPDGGGSGALEKLSTKLSSFISEARGVKCDQLLLSMVQLCYHDTQLSCDVWVEMFPKMWATISDRQRTVSDVVHVYLCLLHTKCTCTCHRNRWLCILQVNRG